MPVPPKNVTFFSKTKSGRFSRRNYCFTYGVVLSFEQGKDLVEEPHEPAEEAVVDLAAVGAMVATGHLLTAGVSVAVVVVVNVAEGGGMIVSRLSSSPQSTQYMILPCFFL